MTATTTTPTVTTVALTAAGARYRVPGSSTGDVFPVRRFTPSAAGDGFVAHVLDERPDRAPAVWSLGVGDWYNPHDPECPSLLRVAAGTLTGEWSYEPDCHEMVTVGYFAPTITDDDGNVAGACDDLFCEVEERTDGTASWSVGCVARGAGIEYAAGVEPDRVDAEQAAVAAYNRAVRDTLIEFDPEVFK